MEIFNLRELLRSADGLKQLQRSIDDTGISVHCSKTDFHYLDFGVIANDEISYEVEIPVGYESVVTDKKILEKELNLSSIYEYTIQKIDVLPYNNPSIPHVSINHEGIDLLTTASPIKLSPNDSIQLNVAIRIDPKFIGFLGRWVIILFERKYKSSLTSFKTESFIFGLRLVGCVSKSKSSRFQLSSEAKIFIPQSSILYFEDKVRIFFKLVCPV